MSIQILSPTSAAFLRLQMNYFADASQFLMMATTKNFVGKYCAITIFFLLMPYSYIYIKLISTICTVHIQELQPCYKKNVVKTRLVALEISDVWSSFLTRNLILAIIMLYPDIIFDFQFLKFSLLDATGRFVVENFLFS